MIRADLAEGLLGFAGSPVKAGLDVLRALRDTFRYVVDFGGLTAASLDDFTVRTVPALNRAVVGPQWERHAELLALLAAGVARAPFGPEPVVTAAGGRGRSPPPGWPSRTRPRSTGWSPRTSSCPRWRPRPAR